MTRRAPIRRFSPRLLELEPRDVPAGNVTANLLGPNYLEVTGDAAGNDIVLRGRGPGVVEIQGINTTINGGNGKLTFSGLDFLVVGVNGGNDAVRSHNLAIGLISVWGGAGDDTIHLDGTTGGHLPYVEFDGGLALEVDGDRTFRSSNANGEDTILVTNTRVRGEYVSISLSGDWYNNVAGDDRRDTITLANTDVAPADEAGYFNLYISDSEEYDSGAGDDITIDRLKTDFLAPTPEEGEGFSPWNVYITTSGGDDHVRIRNSELTGRGDASMLADFSVYDYGAFTGAEDADVIEVENVTMSVLNPSGVGLFNQIFTFLEAERVKVSHVRQEGGVQIDEFGASGAFLGVNATEADLRNVEVTSATGYAGISVFSPFFGEPTDDTFTLANVTVRGGDAFPNLASTYIGTDKGNDVVRVRNSDLGEVDIGLGAGNDTLSLVNTSFDAPYFDEYGFGGIATGDGDDVVSVVSCASPSFRLTTGDGDDELVVVGTESDTLLADLGDGDDTAVLVLNVATESIAVDGGDGYDSLFAVWNFAQMLSFEDFES